MLNKKILEKIIRYTGEAADIDNPDKNTAKTPIFEQSNYYVVAESPYVVVQNQQPQEIEEEVDEEIIKEISKFNYKAVLVPAL